ncbi:MAG: RHS repeat-associated core domain-containing protein, partial [Candidatus Micrarchaeaceae archaeon]
RRRNRSVTPYGIKEKSSWWWRTASGPHVDYNARLYDPALGRFLSVDPLIGHPESTQGINPYSYVENNPLNKTDPTGETGTGSSCSGSGDNQVCTNTTTSTYTPTGSHIPQQTSVTTTWGNGKVMGSSSGPGALSGGRSSTSTDDRSFSSFAPMHTTAANSTNGTDENKHNYKASTDPEKVNSAYDKTVKIKNATEAQTASIRNMLYKIAQTPRGEFLSELAVNSKITVTINVNDQHADDGYLIGTKGTVDIDPNFHPKISTTVGVIRATTIRVLAHELGHAITGALDDGPNNTHMHNVNENENPIVTHLNPPEPARTAYYCPPGGC